MIIPTNDLINYQGDDWEQYLTKICLYDIFKDLFEAYGGDKKVLTGLIRYVVWAYSADSNKIIFRQEWLQNKKRIFKAASLPPDMEQEVVYLKDKTIFYTIKAWLNSQNDENYKVFCMLNDLISEFMIAANSDIRKSITKDNPGGEIDYEQKRKCAESVIDLLVKKSEVEQKFIQNNEKLKEGYKEISHLNSKQSGNSFGVETMLKENQS